MNSPASPTSAAESTVPLPVPKQRKHLMTPGQPRPAAQPNAMSTAKVQKWVATVLTVVILGHLAEALVIFALMAPDDHGSSRTGLLIIAGIVGVLAAGGVRAIHERRILSSWLLIGLSPGLIGLYLAYWR